MNDRSIFGHDKNWERITILRGEIDTWVAIFVMKPNVFLVIQIVSRTFIKDRRRLYKSMRSYKI